MKLVRGDLPALRVQITALLLACVVGGVALLASDHYRSGWVDENERSLRMLEGARTQLRRAQLEEGSFREFSAVYRALAKRGLFEAERRLDWVETMRALAPRHGLLDAHYEISAQRVLAAPPVAGVEPVTASASAVRVEFASVHDQAIVDFLQDLRASAPGIFLFKSCTFARADRTAAEGARDNLHTACDLDWITVKEQTR
jgi:hypothetical protein